MISQIEHDNLQEQAATPLNQQPVPKQPMKLWKQWLIILGGLVFWGIAGQMVGSILAKVNVPVWAPPQVVAGGYIIEQGIDLFSGTIPQLTWHFNLLGALLVVFLIAPTLLLLNFRKLILERSQNSPLVKRWKNVTGFIIGGIICAPFFAMSPFVAYVGVAVSREMMGTQTILAKKDAIRTDLSQLAYQAKMFYFIPTKLGGGGGRWKGIPSQDGTTRDVTLTDLPISSPVIRKIYSVDVGKIYRFVPPLSPNNFAIEPITNDTVLSIASMQYPEIKAIVTPHTLRVEGEEH